MAITFLCPQCEGRFTVEDALAGRKVRCARCGGILTVPEKDIFAADAGPLALADEDAPPPEAPGESPPVADAPPDAPPAAHRSRPVVLDLAIGPDSDAAARKQAGDTVTAPSQSFWNDLAGAFVLPLSARGLAPIGILTVLILIGGLLDRMGAMGRIVGFGLWPVSLMLGVWLPAFFLKTVSETCRGWDELPADALDFHSGSWFDALSPLLSYLTGYLWVWLPLAAYAVLAAFGPVAGPWTHSTVMIALWAVGVLLWPATILAIALEGPRWSALRYDKLLRAIGAAPDRYGAVCLIVTLAKAAEFTVVFRLLFPAQAARWLPAGLAASGAMVLLFPPVSIYLTLVAMRVIGLFYRHSKSRLGWILE